MRRTKIRPRNNARQRKLEARNFGEEAKLVRAMECLARRALALRTGQQPDCQVLVAGLPEGWARCGHRLEAAHVTARGMGGVKGGRFDIVPLCDAHHREAGEAGTSQRAAFEERYGIDLRAEADRIAVEHPEPLGIRGLAYHWADFKIDPGMFEGLDAYEESALLGWAGRRMAVAPVPEFHGGRSELAPREWLVHDLAETLTIEIPIAWTLCEAAGWPS